MKVYIKSFSAFRTVASADVIADSLCVDSAEGDSSTVSVIGEFPRAYSGAWMVVRGQLFLIDRVTPQDGRTTFTLSEPIEAFSRLLQYAAPSASMSIGGWIKALLEANWINQQDPVYAMPYMAVSNLDTSVFLPPLSDDNGLFSITEYIRYVRRMADVTVRMEVQGDALAVRISKHSRTARNIIFGDGHTQLLSSAYSRSGLAKITAVQQIDTGNKDENNQPIYTTEVKDFYLAADGTVSTQIPGVRAEGGWETIFVSAKQDAAQKVAEKFAKNAASHKIEFYSDRDLAVFDPCQIKLYGEILSSYISYKGKASTDSRWLYKSGELATTATEKLRGVNNR